MGKRAHMRRATSNANAGFHVKAPVDGTPDDPAETPDAENPDGTVTGPSLGDKIKTALIGNGKKKKSKKKKK